MRHMEFRHKDIYVKVHTPLIVTRLNDRTEELVYAQVIDIDSRVQAVFAQFHHSIKASDVSFGISYAPKIGETNYDKTTRFVRPMGKYKHISQREDETFVTGIVASTRLLERQEDGSIIFAWDGNILQKLYWTIDNFYDTPMLEEWTPYLLEQLILNGQLIPLTVHDFSDDYSSLVAYDLIAKEELIDEYISSGLRTGKIVLTEDEAFKEAI